MQFYLLAPGARFVFGGMLFMKIAMSMAQDFERIGHVFQGETDVTPIGEILLLSVAEAQKWKPSEIPWTAGMAQSTVAGAGLGSVDAKTPPGEAG